MFTSFSRIIRAPFQPVGLITAGDAHEQDEQLALAGPTQSLAREQFGRVRCLKQTKMFVKACAVGLTRKEGGAPRCLLQLVALARPPALMLEETEVGMKGWMWVEDPTNSSVYSLQAEDLYGQLIDVHDKCAVSARGGGAQEWREDLQAAVRSIFENSGRPLRARVLLWVAIMHRRPEGRSRLLGWAKAPQDPARNLGNPPSPLQALPPPSAPSNLWAETEPLAVKKAHDALLDVVPQEGSAGVVSQSDCLVRAVYEAAHLELGNSAVPQPLRCRRLAQKGVTRPQPVKGELVVALQEGGGCLVTLGRDSVQLRSRHVCAILLELRHDQLSDDPTLFEWLESNLVVEEGGAPPEAERHAAMVVLVHLFCQVRAG